MREDGDRYTLVGADGEMEGIVTGAMKYMAESRLELPAVGDWVVARLLTGENKAIIHAVLSRKSQFVRKEAGQRTEGQVVAANVDVLFLVMGLDGDYNPRRLERYLTVAGSSGAKPVIILNKVDQVDDLETRMAEISLSAQGTPVYAISALHGMGLEQLDELITEGTSVAFLGSSGVGKSTLINALAGGSKMKTAAVREDDNRGRHTTTHRELIPISNGAVLIDTPGMREMSLWGDEEALDSAFPDIKALARKCRHKNCTHQGEPDCAVLAALEDGTLDPARCESYIKLQREMQHLAELQEEGATRYERKKKKGISKAVKAFKKIHRRH